MNELKYNSVDILNMRNAINREQPFNKHLNDCHFNVVDAHSTFTTIDQLLGIGYRLYTMSECLSNLTYWIEKHDPQAADLCDDDALTLGELRDRAVIIAKQYELDFEMALRQHDVAVELLAA